MFDYVIVGAGSAGSVLAARLSEDPNIKVCLIEAGGTANGLLTRVPTAGIFTVPGRVKSHNWCFPTVPQRGLNNRVCFQPRGKGLGGSSLINAMLYIRGHALDYDEWASLGCHGWSFQDVLPFFIKSEDNERGSDALHGRGGPLQVSDADWIRPINQAFLEAAAERGHPINTDFNGQEQEGVGIYQATQFWHGPRKGERCSSAAAYLLDHLSRPSLTIVTASKVLRLELENGRAVGVICQDGRGEKSLRAEREVIVCAGALQTPQLLMLSGIGPADHLKAHGIKVALDQPAVGSNLQDHLDYTMIVRSSDTGCLGLGYAGMKNTIAAAFEWRRHGTGHLRSTCAESGAFLKTDPALDRPDIQLHFLVAMVDDHARKLHCGYGYSAHVCVLRPHSRGTVRLASADPHAAPLIDPAYLTDPRDLEVFRRGVRMTREILGGGAFNRYRGRELYPAGESDAALDAAIRARADTIYHPVGTCRMGSDADAVVDPELKFNGLDGLRIVDASVMPRLIGGNTNAPVIMMAEKTAAAIKAGGKHRASSEAELNLA